MRRHCLSLLLILCPFIPSWGQLPTDYYAAIEGKSDSVLKSALHTLCSGGVRYDYGVTTYHSTNNPPEWQKGDLKAYGTWQALPLTDHKPGTRNGVWDMYSNCNRYYPNRLGDSGCSLNIEHCLPKSWWGGAVNDAYKDLYNLNPSDQRANSQKSNYPPGHVTTADKFDNGSFRMASAKKSPYGYICYEPAEEYRGDFARTYFYMATAYEDIGWTAYPQYISDTTYLKFSAAITRVLLDWHRADPVSDKERCRASVIFDIQGNRNPFIDYPELVEYIWGDRRGQSVRLASLTPPSFPATCADDEIPAETPPCLADTLINLPAITAALVNAVQGTFRGNANKGIQSNGNASITMGTSSTDGEITFTGTLSEDAYLIFRASPYNSATSMQLDIYLDNRLDTTIAVTVADETRHEVRYSIPVPAGTQTIRIASVGGSTSRRACIQELYLLCCRPFTTGIPPQPDTATAAHKILQNGRLIIRRGTEQYTILGIKY